MSSPNECACDCATEMPYDPNDPGAYPGPDEECVCYCHEGRDTGA